MARNTSASSPIRFARFSADDAEPNDAERTTTLTKTASYTLNRSTEKTFRTQQQD